MRKLTVAIIVILLSLSSAVYANSLDGVALGVKAGMLGFGVEGDKVVSSKFSVRAGINYYSYSYDSVEADVDYSIDLDLQTVGVILDWHPFEGSFRLSGGVFHNGNEINMTAKSNVTTDIGGIPYSAAELGTLKGKIDFNSFAPYAGLGWNTSFKKDKGFGFIFELGALFQGSPEVDLSADGLLASDPTFLSNLAAEEADLQSALDSFKVFPVVSIGVNYRF